MDPFDDIFAPVQTNARAGAKFQPKVKQRLRKATPASSPSLVPCDQTKKINHCLVSGPSVLASNVTKSKEEIPGSSYLAPSGGTEIEESSKKCKVTTNEELQDLGDGHSGFRAPESEVDCVDRFIDDSKELASSNVPTTGLDTETSVLLDDVGKLATENVDIFFGLENLDDFVPHTTSNTENEGSKSESKVDMGVKHVEKVLTSCCVDTDLGGSASPFETETHSVEDFSAQGHCSFDTSEFTIYDVVPPQICSDHEEVLLDNGKSETEVTNNLFDVETCEATVVTGQRSGKFKPRPKLRNEKDKPSTVNHQAEAGSSLPSKTVHWAPSSNECTHEDSIPEFPKGNALDSSSARLGDTLGHENEEPTGFTEATYSHGADLGVMHSEDNPVNVVGQTRTTEISTEPHCLRKSKRSSTTSKKEVEGGNSSRQLRKWLRQIVDEPADEDQSTNDPTYEPPSTSNRDEDEDNNDETIVGISSRKRKAPKKAKEPLSGNDKPGPKRKNAKKASESTKEAPPKKFSHSSRRNKRTVDQALLDIPEDEIDTQRLPIKDLILLAEHRERLMIKDAAAKVKTAQNNQSADGSLHEDVSHNEEESLSEHGQNSDEDQPRYEPSSSYVNYQTYMNKTPTTRWSKLDTELFYQAVQQFGTDFSMIQQLFPNRTRHQIKLKFKSEERQHPLRLSEAATNRAKDHSHFESVIERLKQASAAKQESFGQDSVGITEEEEAEDTAHYSNDGATKLGQDDETMKEQEADVVEVHNSPLKSYESDGDDDLNKWNQYNY